MERFVPTKYVKRTLIPDLFVLFASSGVASAAEEGNWFESLLDGSKANAEEGRNNVTPSHVFRATGGTVRSRSTRRAGGCTTSRD